MNRFDRTALYAALLLIVVACGGCACKQPGQSYTCALQWVSGAYTTIGVGVVTQTACDQYAVARAKQGNDDAADAAIGKCKTLNKLIHDGSDATATVLGGIKTIHQAGGGDYSAALLSGVKTMCELNATIIDVDPKAQLVLSCGGK